jgi:circadian clock protein KaiC
MKSGIPGLDPLVEGGLQQGDFLVLAGDMGTGKTVFASQFLYYAAKSGDEPGVFATFEEDARSLKRNMLRFGMDFDALQRENKLRILDLETLAGSGGISSNLQILTESVAEIGAKRLVIDSLTAFLAGVEQKIDYRILMNLVYKLLKRDEVTTLMTVSKPQGNQGTSMEEFIADGAFELRNCVIRDIELRTQFVVRKLRGTEHSRKFHSVLFTSTGLQILP